MHKIKDDRSVQEEYTMLFFKNFVYFWRFLHIFTLNYLINSIVWMWLRDKCQKNVNKCVGFIASLPLDQYAIFSFAFWAIIKNCWFPMLLHFHAILVQWYAFMGKIMTVSFYLLPFNCIKWWIKIVGFPRIRWIIAIILFWFD